MSKTRLLLACCVASLALAVPTAPPAAADETPCPEGYAVDYILGLLPGPAVGSYAAIADGTITIRGDLLLADGRALVEHYASSTARFIECLGQDVGDLVSPYVECVTERSEPILTSPDPVGRYVEVGTDLVVRIHYELAMDEAIHVANCNGIVTSGG